MKKYIISILILFLSTNFICAQDADPALDINMQLPVVGLNLNSKLEVTAGNNGQTTIVANSLVVTISVNINAEIIGLDPLSNPNWTVTISSTGAGNTYKLKNTSGMLAAFQQDLIILTVKGVALGGPSIITGNLSYIVGINPLITPPAPSAAQGNLDNTNDNQQTSLEVTSVLPIKLISFNGIEKDCNSIINWQSNNEVNFNRYEVEYSMDARNYSTVGILKGQGIGSISNYQFTFPQKNSKSFYRLKMIDNDGTVNYSNTIKIANSCYQTKANVYPNPVSSNQNPTVFLQNFGTKILGNLYDETGKLLQAIKLNNSANKLNLINYSSGNYILKINDENNNSSILRITIAR